MPPSFKPFTRGITGARGKLRTIHGLDALAHYVSREIDARQDPRFVSLSALRRMDTDPIVYLAEWAITGLMRDPELYHVTHPHGEKKVEQETYEWLWPLLPSLLPMIARSFIYGAIPYVFDWTKEDLVIRTPSKTKGKRSRKQTLVDHVHYSGVHEIFPSEPGFVVDDQDVVQEIHWAGRVYDKGQSRLSIWDRQFGEISGQSARRRAWAPYAKGEIFTILQAKYLERTVHAPLLIYGSAETVKEDGDAEELSLADFIAEAYSELMGGGTMTLPADFDASGNRIFEAVPLELPERSEVFDRSLNRFDGLKFAAYLTPPGMAGFDESAGSGASRVLKEMFSVFVGCLVRYAATELTAIVEEVHKQNHDPSKVAPPEVNANQIPDKVQKTYLDVLKFVADPGSVGQRIDVDSLMDQIGIPRKSQEDVDASPIEPPPGKPGRKREATSDREERREDARTEEGEEDTGGEQDREEQD